MTLVEVLREKKYTEQNIVDRGSFEAMNQKWHLLQMDSGEYLNLIEFPENSFELDKAH